MFARMNILGKQFSRLITFATGLFQRSVRVDAKGNEFLLSVESVLQSPPFIASGSYE